MIILVSGATKDLAKHPEAGVLLVPRNRQYHVGTGRPWAADNGAFTGFDGPAFMAMLDRLHAEGKLGGCLFITCPDVVGDATATRALFDIWEPQVRIYRKPVAFVLQNGQDRGTVPWDRCGAVFVGGVPECIHCGYVRPKAERNDTCPTCRRKLTEWKTGKVAEALVALAKLKGKWVHMGRVNTRTRIRLAVRWGVDSIDGTTFSKYGDLPSGVAWIDQAKRQGALWSG